MKENKEQVLKNVYFCPYCRVASAKTEDFKAEFRNGKWVYKCIARKCGKFFYQNTYKEQNKNGKHYFTIVNSRDVENSIDVETLIEKIIIDVYMRVASYRKVAELTHFSRSRVEKTIQKRICKSREYKLNEFFEEVLQIDREYRRNNSAETIVKMLEFGFTKNQIMTLLKIDYYYFQDLINGYTIEEQVKHKIKVSGKKITYSHFIDKI